MDKSSFVKKLTVSIILLAITILFYIVQCNIIKLTENTLPKGIAFSSANGMNLSFDEAKKANIEVEDNSITKRYEYVLPGEERKETNEVKAVSISAVGIKKAQLTSELSSEITQVNVVLTDEKYADIVPMDMVIGNYFTVSKVPEENRFIVISDKLAVKYFKNYDVIGLDLKINQQDYTICGVYRSDNSLTSKLSSNGLDNVYMPYSGMQDYDKMPVNFLLAGTNTKFSQAITDKIIKNTGKDPYPDLISNYSDTLALVRQSKSVTIFLCGIIIMITLFVILLRQIKKTYHSYKKEECKRDILIKAGIGLLYLIGIVVLFLIVKFKIYFPQDMLPPDNIFDVKFYINIIVSSMQKGNSILLYDYNLNFAYMSMVLSAMAGLLTFVSFVVTYVYVVVNTRRWIGAK